MADDYKVSKRVGKALTLPSAPAYTFGGRHEKPPVDPGPGPGRYGTLWSIGTKGTGFGTSARADWQLNANPAGAAYQPRLTQTNNSKPSYTFGGKSKKGQHEQTPGPGAYEPRAAGKLVKPSPAAYTLAARPAGDQDPERSPGPAEYSPEFRPRDVHVASVKFRSSLPTAAMPTPGPGEYDTPRRRPCSEGKTFGVSRSDRVRSNGVPGPGEYGVPQEPSRPRRASWTISRASRDAGFRGPGSPGPGTYDVSDALIPRDGGHSVASDHRSQPAYTFGGRIPWGVPQGGPGPADYGVPADPGKVTKPAFSLHGANYRQKGPEVPGPGAYQPGAADELVRRSAPAVSMALRAYEPGAKDLKPGPGMYDPKDPDGKIAVSLKFRNEMHPDHEANPAPHDYADKDFRDMGRSYDGTAVRKGFTMRPRYRDDRRERVPGPQYAVGCSTLGVAAGSMLDKSKVSMTVVL